MLAQILTPRQIQAVHETSIRTLEKVGILLPHEDMLSRLEDAGAKVDHAEHRAWIPEHLVVSCLATAGKQFVIYGRDVHQQASFGTGARNYNASAGQASWVDEPGGPRRYATLADVQAAARCCDALPSINIAGAMADPHEVPIEYRCVEVLATMIRSTTKPLTLWFHDRVSAKYIVEMMIALRGSVKAASERPLCYPFLEPISPLRFPRNGVDLLYETARLNLPVPIGPMAQMGSSSPATMAATLAQENAEILAGVCITQMIQPGMPVCYGGIPHAFDMRTTQLIFSGPEQAIFGVAMTQMGKHYGLPVYINSGLTDSKIPDAQAGLEAGMTLVLGAAAGADIFGHMGISGVDQGGSLDMLVLQAEIIAYVESVMRRMEFGDEALALDVIAERGPGASFLDHEHTAAHFRRELWFPGLLNRQFYQAWLEEGGMSLQKRCQQKKESILANHHPQPVAPDVDRAVEDILHAARKELVAGRVC
jgi:trimethylamine--corrinoid protein Co-methyltransferase